MDKLEEVTNYVKKQARNIVESGEEHQPIMLALNSEGVNACSLATINEEIFKANFKQTMSKLLQMLNAYAYIFINEAWGAKLREDSPTAKRILSGETSVSKLPLDDREEILTIMVAENGKSFYCWSAKIRYTPEGKRYLGEWEEMLGIIGGRLILKEW